MSSSSGHVATGLNLDRVVVVGISGAGKSTLARTLASRLGSPHVELDAIQWLPGWVAKIRSSSGPRSGKPWRRHRWVVDGNYARSRDLIWPRATTIIWLDYRFPLVFWRAVSHTVKRS